VPTFFCFLHVGVCGWCVSCKKILRLFRLTFGYISLLVGVATSMPSDNVGQGINSRLL
jgi:hypothetical protein